MRDGKMKSGVLDLAGGRHGVRRLGYISGQKMCGACVAVTNSGAVQNKFLVMRCLRVCERRVKTSSSDIYDAGSGRGWLDLPVR